MDTMLTSLSYATAYVDDVIVVGTSVDGRLTNLGEVFWWHSVMRSSHSGGDVRVSAYEKQLSWHHKRQERSKSGPI